jgi:hypothetical protein
VVIKALGKFLKSCFRGGFEPYFLVEDEAAEPANHTIRLTESMINDMHLRGYFNIDPFVILVSKELSLTSISLGLQSEPYLSGASCVPISGFPRRLVEGGKKREGECS